MKQIHLFFFLLFFTFSPILSQIENDTVYWYFISYRIYEFNRIPVKISVKEKIFSGSTKEYDRELWKYLGKGKFIANGPFNTLDEAEFSKKLYFLSSTQNYPDTSILTAYVFQIRKRSRSNSIQMISNPKTLSKTHIHI